MAGLADMPPEVSILIGSYCDKETIRSIVSVCIQTNVKFSACRSKDFRACADAGWLASYLQTLLAAKPEERITHWLSAIANATILVNLSLPPQGSEESQELPEPPYNDLVDSLGSLLCKMVELRYLRLDIECLPAESMGRLAELIHSYRRECMASKGTPLQHCALHINASAEVTLAFLATYNPSQFKSLHCDVKELTLPEERSMEPEDTILRLYSGQYRNIIKMQNLERLCICFSPDEQDEQDEQEESISGLTTETTFTEIREITSYFPRLEWLIIHDNTAFIQDYMEVVGLGTVYHGQQFDRICNYLQSRTNLTHLAFTIHSHRMSLQLRIHNLLDEDDPIGNQITRLYFRLARRLVEANPRLQHVVLMDEWPYHYSARKDDLGVVRTDKKDGRDVGTLSSFPHGLWP